MRKNKKKEDLEKLYNLDGIKIVVSKETFKVDKEVFIIPLWLFLLIS